jgi:hypothetical protein
VGITFSLQPVMKWACERLEGFWRVIVADVFLFVSFVGTVNVWRGIWGLLDIYFLPGRPLKCAHDTQSQYLKQCHPPYR